MMHSVRMPAIELLPAEVIKAFAQGLNAAKALLGGWPEIRLPSSETANVVVLMAEEDDSLEVDVIVRGALETTLSVDANMLRYGRVLAVIDLAYYLRTHDAICSLREAHYHFKAFDPEDQFYEFFRDESDCYQAIADAAALFNVQRRALGFEAAPKGLFAGCVFWRSGGSDAWADGRDGTREIDSGWLTDHARQLRSNAECVLVIISATRKHMRSSTPSRLA